MIKNASKIRIIFVLERKNEIFFIVSKNVIFSPLR